MQSANYHYRLNQNVKVLPFGNTNKAVGCIVGLVDKRLNNNTYSMQSSTAPLPNPTLISALDNLLRTNRKDDKYFRLQRKMTCTDFPNWGVDDRPIED